MKELKIIDIKRKLKSNRDDISGMFDIKTLLFINNNILSIAALKQEFEEFGFNKGDDNLSTPHPRFKKLILNMNKSLLNGHPISSDAQIKKFITNNFDLLNKMKDYTGHEKIFDIFRSITFLSTTDSYIKYVLSELNTDKANELLNKLLSMGITHVDFNMDHHIYEYDNSNSNLIKFAYLDSLTMIPSKNLMYERNDDTTIALLGKIIKNEQGESLVFDKYIDLSDLSIDPDTLPDSLEDIKYYIQFLEFKHEIANSYSKLEDVLAEADSFFTSYEKIHNSDYNDEVDEKIDSANSIVNEIKESIHEFGDDTKKVIASRDSSYKYNGPVKVIL